MTLKELKQKAEAEADKVIIGSGMDRASVAHLRHLLVTMYMQGYMHGASENGVVWHKVADGDLPEYQMGENYAQIPCLCKIKNYGFGVRFWNVKEQCWDTEDGDDYYCKKDMVIEWQEIHSDDKE